ANISPLPTAAFFDKLARQEPGGAWTAVLESHPASAERARQFRAAAHSAHAYRPALTPAEWQALARICQDDRTAKPVLDF
ncbi:hypothetical protein ABTM19_20790, partial [Acinetobacter baumannii]